MIYTINNRQYHLPDEFGNIEALGEFQKYIKDIDSGVISLPDVLVKLSPYSKVTHLTTPTYAELREKEYLALGITEKELAVAMWEWKVEGRSEAKDAIQAKREIVKTKFPKV